MNLALFGGTFDPVHRGHIVLAEESVKACELNRVVFVPCGQSPHKSGIEATPGADRLAMLELATAQLPWTEVDDWELNREGPSYSWQTAAHYRELHPGACLFWILGADQWQVIEQWSRPEVLAGLLHFIVFPRTNCDPPEPKEGFRSTILTTTNPGSATAIRRAIAGGNTLPDGALHPDVADYIAARNLYSGRA